MTSMRCTRCGHHDGTMAVSDAQLRSSKCPACGSMGRMTSFQMLGGGLVADESSRFLLLSGIPADHPCAAFMGLYVESKVAANHRGSFFMVKYQGGLCCQSWCAFAQTQRTWCFFSTDGSLRLISNPPKDLWMARNPPQDPCQVPSSEWQGFKKTHDSIRFKCLGAVNVRFQQLNLQSVFQLFDRLDSEFEGVSTKTKESQLRHIQWLQLQIHKPGCVPFNFPLNLPSCETLGEQTLPESWHKQLSTQTC